MSSMAERAGKLSVADIFYNILNRKVYIWKYLAVDDKLVSLLQSLPWFNAMFHDVIKFGHLLVT